MKNVLAPSIVDTSRARLPQKNPPRKLIDTGPSFALTRGFSPVMLTSGEVVVNYGGGVAVPNHGLLQPVERSAMLVDEIHFNTRLYESTGGWVDSRWPIRAKISMGRFSVTNDFVPIAGLEYTYLTNSMYNAGATSGTDYAGRTFTGARWKLPVPLYVPAGSLLYTELQMSGAYFFANTSAAVDTTYIGRLLPVDYPVPATIRIPYVTSIVSPDVGSGNVNTLLQSKDLQLGNPFDTTLYAQRLIMRNFETIAPYFVESYNGGVPLVTLRGTFNNIDISVAQQFNHYTVFDDGMTLSLAGTMGHHVYNLFNLELAPKDRLDLLIDWRATNYTSFEPLGVASLVGWRNEVI